MQAAGDRLQATGTRNRVQQPRRHDGTHHAFLEPKLPPRIAILFPFRFHAKPDGREFPFMSRFRAWKPLKWPIGRISCCVPGTLHRMPPNPGFKAVQLQDHDMKAIPHRASSLMPIPVNVMLSRVEALEMADWTHFLLRAGHVARNASKSRFQGRLARKP